MDVKEAIQRGWEYIEYIYGDRVSHIEVEEVTPPKSEVWSITYGFFRDYDAVPRSIIERMSDETFVLGAKNRGWRSRTFKIVEIYDESGEIKGMRHRAVPGKD